MDSPALFVDFMYAVVVGAALPRFQDADVLRFSSPVAWGLLFLIAVFLEDFYLYHTQVVPYLKGFPRWRSFILTMLIIGSWYLCQAAFPNKPLLFIGSFAFFFILKLTGGFFMKPTRYPSIADWFFCCQ